MPVLSQQEISELESIKNVALENFTTQDAIDYYTYLQNKGFDYATLALGVVQNNTARGKIANSYAASVAVWEGVDFTVGSAAWRKMQYELMQNDFAARDQAGGAEPPFEAYDNAHTLALQEVGLPPEAWTAYVPLTQIEQVDPLVAAAVWDDLTTDTGFFDGWFTEGLYSLGLNTNVATDQSRADMAAAYGAQMKWYANMAIALIAAGGQTVDELLPELSFPQLHEDLEDFASFLGGVFGVNDPVGAPWLLGFPETPAPACLVPSWADGAADLWNDAQNTGSPLVLDLSGSGIALTTFNAGTTETFFDIDGDGFAEQTAWTGANMGLLARDLNENGRIDGVDELFGSPSIDGFALLATLDSNGDHVIDQYDSAWGDLVVWVDANGDAVTQDGELQTLVSLDVVSFDLAGVAASTSTVGGNPISHTSTYRLANGATRSIVDAWFVHDNVNSTYVGDYDLDVRALFLPTLRGFGELADLHIAMSQDEDLLELVQDFVENWDVSRFGDEAALDSDVQDILWTWAGVEEMAPNARGQYVDARNLTFLEQFFGQDFIQIPSQNANPWALAGAAAEEAWDFVFGSLKARLIVQAGAALFEDTAYSVWSGDLEGDLTLSQGYVDDLEAAAPAPGSALEAYWEEIARFIEYSKGLANLTSGENTMINAAIVATDNTLSWTEIKTGAFPSDNAPVYGTSGADTLTGDANSDTIYGQNGNDTIDGEAGHDTLYGGSGADTIYGDAGNDTIYGDADNDILLPGGGGNTVWGGNGNDTYVYDGGTDLYSEYGATGTDTITLPSGISAGDLVFYRNLPFNYTTFDDLYVEVGDAGAIELYKYFYQGRTLQSNLIETFTFADTATMSTVNFTALTTYGSTQADNVIGVILGSTEVNDTIYGYGGNDYLSGAGGNDVLDGGEGNDRLDGGAGNDIFLASAGFDQIEESSGTDKIVLSAGYTAADVSLLRSMSAANDLTITIAGLGQIVVKNQFNGSGNIVETVEFADTSTINLTTSQIETFGTDGNNTISGITSGASVNDILDGRGGNDTLNGLGGDDTYYFSAGVDTIGEQGGNDTIKFRQGVLPTDVSIYRMGKALYLEDVSGNILSATHFTTEGGSSNANLQIESISFHDGPTWLLSAIEVEARGTSGNDTLTGASAGDASSADTMYGYAGNDSLLGGSGNDWLDGGLGDDSYQGGGGDDTFVVGQGLDTVSETTQGGGNDTLYIAGGTTINDITLSNSGTFDTKITISSGVDEITVKSLRSASTSNHIESIAFDDGFVTSLPDYASWTKGTSGNDTVAGNSSDNTLIGYAGNDTITGGDGNDDAHGGAGNDSLDGGNGNDLLYGGDGDDVIYGKAGLDTLKGGAGADTYVMETASAFSNVDVIRDFNPSEGDVLDVTDILDLVYDPINDAIGDFVSFTESSGSTFVSVDRDGTGGTYSMAQIVKFEGLTGLALPATLETNGNLIAA